MKMNTIDPEVPAAGILKVQEYPDAIWYEVICDCGSRDHSHSIWIEKDSDTGLIEVSISTESTTDNWTKSLDYAYDDKLFQLKWFVDRILIRAKLMWEVLVHGCIRRESHVLLTRQQAINYGHALINSVNKIGESTKNEK